eukprot:759488-Hanusia_phi.AAC.4
MTATDFAGRTALHTAAMKVEEEDQEEGGHQEDGRRRGSAEVRAGECRGGRAACEDGIGSQRAGQGRPDCDALCCVVLPAAVGGRPPCIQGDLSEQGGEWSEDGERSAEDRRKREPRGRTGADAAACRCEHGQCAGVQGVAGGWGEARRGGRRGGGDARRRSRTEGEEDEQGGGGGGGGGGDGGGGGSRRRGTWSHQCV